MEELTEYVMLRELVAGHIGRHDGDADSALRCVVDAWSGGAITLASLVYVLRIMRHMIEDGEIVSSLVSEIFEQAKRISMAQMN